MLVPRIVFSERFLGSHKAGSLRMKAEEFVAMLKKEKRTRIEPVEKNLHAIEQG